MNVALTGGTGCLGQPLLRRLLGNGHNVKLLVEPNDHRIFPAENLSIISGTVNDEHALRELVEGSDIVFHLAAKVHEFHKTPSVEHEFHEINSEGTRLLVEISKQKKVKRIVFYSTVGVYGKDSNFHGDEISSCNPNNPYSQTKYMAERYVLESFKTGGPDGVVLRFPVVYGPFDRGNIFKLIEAVYKRQFFIIGNGKNLRSMISSENTAVAALLAGTHPKAANQIFCVTDGRDYTIEEILDTICTVLGFSCRPIHLPLFAAKTIGNIGDISETIFKWQAPLNTDRVRKLSSSLTFSCDKIQKELGYRPVQTLEEGIRDEVKSGNFEIKLSKMRRL